YRVRLAYVMPSPRQFQELDKVPRECERKSDLPSLGSRFAPMDTDGLPATAGSQMREAVVILRSRGRLKRRLRGIRAPRRLQRDNCGPAPRLPSQCRVIPASL